MTTLPKFFSEKTRRGFRSRSHNEFEGNFFLKKPFPSNSFSEQVECSFDNPAEKAPQSTVDLARWPKKMEKTFLFRKKNPRIHH